MAYIETNGIRIGKKRVRKKQRKRDWQQVAVVVAILFGIVTSVLNFVQFLGYSNLQSQSNALQTQANKWSEENLEYQSILSNSTPIMDIDAQPSSFDAVYYLMSDIPLTPTGSLNGTVTIITPHYGNITVEILNFTSESSNYLVPEKQNQTSVTTTFEYNLTRHESPILGGLSVYPFNIDLQASFYSQPVTGNGSYVGFSIGLLYLDAKFYDAEAKTTYTQVFSSRIFVQVLGSG